MEVIHTSYSDHNTNNNDNSSNINSNINTSCRRSTSLLSLTSVESDLSYQTCYEHHSFEKFNSDYQHEHPASTTLSMSHRIPSFVNLLEDVMEEDAAEHSSSSASPSPSREHLHLVPRQSFSQLQQQPLSPRLKAARLALSSNIGMLRKSLSSGSNHSNCSSNDVSLYKTKQKQQQQQKHQPTTAAFPMSRSFATPRAAVGTVFRPSLSAASLNSLHTTSSFCSMKEFDDVPSMQEEGCEIKEEKEAEELFPMVDIVTSITMRASLFPCQSHQNKPVDLRDMADDIHIHILQFLTLPDIRSLMATNTQFRRLLFTKDAEILWKHQCSQFGWQQVLRRRRQHDDSNKTTTTDYNGEQDELVLIDDLSLPIAARPSTFTHLQIISDHGTTDHTDLSSWHHQANMSLLLSMGTCQPTDIDREQLSEYTTWQGRGRRRQGPRRFHGNGRIRTTTDDHRPLLRCQYAKAYQNEIVQFIGRVGQGDRCIRSNAPLPRPTLMTSKDATWVLSPDNNNNNTCSWRRRISYSGHRSVLKHHRRGSSLLNHSLVDLFCRKVRAVTAPCTAWRPFVAPFMSKDMESVVHLTPRFVSYFEVSILEPTLNDDDENENHTSNVLGTTANNNNNNDSSRRTDCVAVGLATDSFDWHSRMPGWDASSYGYHGDDGGIFHSSGGMLRKFGPSYGRGDVVGCGVDHVAGGIFFTLNGEFLGYAWSGLPVELLQKDMYPVVGIDTNDYIMTNFGTQPFVYDLKSLCVKHEDLIHQSLAASVAAR